MSGAWSNDRLFSSHKQDWSTPPALFRLLSARWGPFTLDAAAHQGNARCERWLGPGGVHEDALAAPWDPARGEQGFGSPVWLNPPYGRQVGRWLTRARVQAGFTGRKVVCLTFARTDTRWWHDEVMRYASFVDLIRGRVVFTDAQGHPNMQRTKAGKLRVLPAPAPSCVIVFQGCSGTPTFRSLTRPKEAWDRPGWTPDDPLTQRGPRA